MLSTESGELQAPPLARREAIWFQRTLWPRATEARAPSFLAFSSMPRGWHGHCSRFAQEALMLWTLVLVMLVLWALGLATSYTLGGLLHLLLLVALVVAVIQLVQGRRVV